MDQKKRLFNYVNGWVTGASMAFIPESMKEDDDFLEGWNEGRLARNDAKKRAEDKFGVKFAKIKVMSPNERPG